MLILKVAATGMEELHFSHNEWESAKKIKNILEKPYLATLRLQSADLTPGMFFKERCYLKQFLQEDGDRISLTIYAAMKEREIKLISNTHFLAAVYVDPRYRILLTYEQQLLAKQGLLDISLRIEKLKAVENICLLSDNEIEDVESISNSDNDEFEKGLDVLARRQCTTSNSLSQEVNFQDEFKKNCYHIEKLGRIKSSNVFEGLQKYPSSFQLPCQIVSSMPVSQVSVERLFSSLKLVMSDLRFALKDDLLSSILFYRSNCS